MKFRRNTHDRDGTFREEIFGHKTRSASLEWPWDEHGYIVHMLTSEKGMTFNELITQIRYDETNFRVVMEGPCDDRTPIPTPEEVAFGLIRLVEVGYVEVVIE